MSLTCSRSRVLELVAELIEAHRDSIELLLGLDTVELLVDLRATDTDVGRHVGYLRSLELEGRAMVARESL